MPPSFLHSTSMTWPWTLGLGTKESSPLCTTPGRWKPLPATLETLGLESPRWQEPQHQTGIQKDVLLGLQKYKYTCLVLLSSSPSFQVRKGAGVYRWERYVAILLRSKWNQSCALTGRYQWEHQTVSKTHRPSAARGGWLWPDVIPSINRLRHCRRATC